VIARSTDGAIAGPTTLLEDVPAPTGVARTSRLGDIRPASTMVQVVALVRPEMRVEIEAYAVVDVAA
jgi:enamine deaminase RidA (YjgF/YER057c/UK114 family)